MTPTQRPFVRASLAGIAVGVVVAAGWTAARPDGTDEARPSTTVSRPTSSTTTAPLGPATQAEIDAAVGELLAFVTEVRGLTPTGDVPVVLQDEDTFVTGLLEALDSSRDLAGFNVTLRGLNLVEAGFDLLAQVEAAATEGVLGYYDTDADTLYVRGTALTPLVRMTLVHELVHALQDQHFDLDAVVEDGDDEADAGGLALVEGDAQYVTNRYVASLSPAAQAALLSEAADMLIGADGGLGEGGVVEAMLGFPYLSGPTFIEDLVETGPAETFGPVDAAFDAPPASTEQILHPEKYVAGEAPAKVRQPSAKGEVIDKGVLGEFLLGYLLSSEMPRETALEAAAGWGGDAYTTWREEEDEDQEAAVVVAVRLVMDTARDLEELVKALERWAARQEQATVTTAENRVLVETRISDGPPGGGSRQRTEETSGGGPPDDQ